MPVLIDSDVLVEISRARDLGLLQRWRELSESDETLLCSPITVAELWRGARPSEVGFLENLLDILVCVPIDKAVGRLAGEFMRKYARSHSVELADALIAATAVESEAVLWTRNRKHYPMPGVRLY